MHVAYKELKHNNTHSSNNLKLPCTTNTTSFSWSIYLVIIFNISTLFRLTNQALMHHDIYKLLSYGDRIKINDSSKDAKRYLLTNSYYKELKCFS